MQINIDRLHDVLEGKRFGRGDGRTLAGLVQLAQYVDFFPYGKLAHFSANFTHARDHAVTFYDHAITSIGLDKELTQRNRDYCEFENGCKVYFMSLGEGAQRVEDRLRGLRLNNYVVDHFAEYLMTSNMKQVLTLRSDYD